MTLKDGAKLIDLSPDMVRALPIVNDVYHGLGIECVITSGKDSVHSGKPVAGDHDDPHYTGKALDFRLTSVPELQRPALVALITNTLGVDFYVARENVGTEREHLHVQAGHVA